jgi:hypothetical protein
MRGRIQGHTIIIIVFTQGTRSRLRTFEELKDAFGFSHLTFIID